MHSLKNVEQFNTGSLTQTSVLVVLKGKQGQDVLVSGDLLSEYDICNQQN